MLRSYANRDEVEEGTLVRLFLDTVDRYQDRPALQYFEDGVLRDLTHAEVFRAVRCAAAALGDFGLHRGDRVGILAENRPEWAIADYGCLCAGVLDVPIYSTLIPEQIAYLIRDSGARLIFCSTTDQVEKVLAIREECPSLETVVSFDRVLAEGVVQWKDFIARGAAAGASVSDEEFRLQASQAGPHDVATLLYTSGTTGEPKGVMLTHNNLFSNTQASRVALDIGGREQTLSFLPLSHVLQRMVDYLLFSAGCSIAYARSIQTVSQDIKVVRPTIVVSVPRLYEKIYNRVVDKRGVSRILVNWACRTGEAWAEATLAGRTPSLGLRLRYGIADKLVFSKVREGMGGRLKILVSGGAPLSPDINRFFYFAGLHLLEGYGLSETSPVTNVNTRKDFRLGTVGKPVPGTEIRIADDGEILVRGPQVMKGYFNRPDLTAQVIDAEGWFVTGDIGEIDDDGFLRITDRKKDLIVTAGGKNIAPQPIENRLKTNPYVDQLVMLGDRRQYPVLLVVPDFEVLEAWARSAQIPFGNRGELLARSEVQELLRAEILGRLSHLAPYETPKRLGVLSEEFTIENGALTPSMKVKRRVVEDRYRELIDAMYEDDDRGHAVWVS